MTYEQLQAYEKVLAENGYRRTESLINRSDYQWYKAFGREDNPYEEDRSMYQIFICVWDWRKYADRDPYNRDRLSLSCVFDVSRTSNDRVNMDYSFRDDTEIDLQVIEKRARNFLLYCEAFFPLQEQIVTPSKE